MREKLLLIEAALALGLCAGAIRLLAFRRVARVASLPLRRTRRGTDIAAIRWTVDAVANRAPFRAKCFERGLAAHLMLRRRGLASILYYGAALDAEGALTAHVWVKVADIDVIGGENSGCFALLACFPKALAGDEPPNRERNADKR